eukprot:Sspe_Gene.22415::Locus_8532_Transcript_2_2_Confidence_0.667_Length_2400::g.22415::m.22415
MDYGKDEKDEEPKVGLDAGSLVAAGDDSVLLCGCPPHGRDLELYEWSPKGWVRLHGGNAPSGRRGHATAYLRGSLYLHGGWDIDYQYLAWDGRYDQPAQYGDLWRYDMKSQTWITPPRKSPSAPCARAAHSMDSISEDSLLVFGGVQCAGSFVEEMLNDTWILKEGADGGVEWAKVETRGTAPRGRGFHSSLLSHDALYIFGGWWQQKDSWTGQRRDVTLNDLFFLNLTTQTWVEIEYTCSGYPKSWSSVAQPFRINFAARPLIAHSDGEQPSLLVYDPGGRRPGTAAAKAIPEIADSLDDGETSGAQLYSLDLRSKSWTLVFQSKSPARLFCRGTAKIQGNIVMYGGMDMGPGGYSHQMCCLDVEAVDEQLQAQKTGAIPSYEYLPFSPGETMRSEADVGTCEEDEALVELRKSLHAVGVSLEEVSRYSPADLDELLREELKIPVVHRNRMKDSLSKYIATRKGEAQGKEIAWSDLKLESVLGQGHFGQVWKGTWRMQCVAVKELNTDSADGRKQFVSEISSLWHLRHPNIVTCMGHCMKPNGQVLLVTELCDEGSLEKYLDRMYRSHANITVGDLLSIACDVASAMYHLQCEMCIHRDLAVRNIFRTRSGVCKVGDFGLSRAVEAGSVYSPTGTTDFPILWTSPETLASKKWDISNDVWSFGIVLWECLMYAQQHPYQHLFKDPVQAILQHRLLPMPPSCPLDIWEGLVLQCWHPAASRPLFDKVLSTVKKLQGRYSASASLGGMQLDHPRQLS